MAPLGCAVPHVRALPVVETGVDPHRGDLGRPDRSVDQGADGTRRPPSARATLFHQHALEERERRIATGLDGLPPSGGELWRHVGMGDGRSRLVSEDPRVVRIKDARTPPTVPLCHTS